MRSRVGGARNSNLQRYVANNPKSKGMEFDRIPFIVPGRPTVHQGHEATDLIEICNAYLDAEDEDLLKPSQRHLARHAQAIIRACAKVGVIALVDEATGYQAHRAKRALQFKLQSFIAEEMAEWAKQFPDEFWLELARLEGIHYSPRSRPLRWGRYVMQFVYDAIDPDVGQKLRELNPDPRHRMNHHQWLKTYGQQKLQEQLTRVITIMKLCVDMKDFRAKFAHVFRRAPLQLEFEQDGF